MGGKVVVHVEEMGKAVHHPQLDLVQENNKNVLSLDPVQRGNEMVETTTTATKITTCLYVKPDNLQISFKITISLDSYIKAMK